MVAVAGFNAGSQIIDPKTGKLTGEGFRLIQFLVSGVNGDANVVTSDGTLVLTNKTIDGDNNDLQDIATSSLKSRTGPGSRVATGTAGASGEIAVWSAGGDIEGGGFDADDILVATDIGVSVQPFNAGTLTTSNIGVSVQAYDADLTTWAGKTAPAGVVVGTTDAQNLSSKTFLTPPILPEYNVAGVPSAATYDNGVIIVANEAGGRTLATSDGTNWRRVSNGAVIS